MTAILTDTSQTALWVDLVHEAETGAATRLDEELESYLVFLLIAHLRDVHLHHHAMAIDFLLARAESGARRRQELRDVGDRCLLLAGLYPEQAEKRRVSLGYFLDLGSRSYDELSHALRAGVADLYGRLAAGFARLVRVLIEMRSRMREVGPLLLHEIAMDGSAGGADPHFPGAVLIGGNDTRQ
ncbi:MAG TPA: hypothetical protein VF132_09210 [Rudaea sp.]